jgi:uncharacterized membrane protein YfcA
MNLYLPIAEMTQNLAVLVGLGIFVGFLSGLFGIGGGFLLTPALMFIGIPQAVAVSSTANQLVGTSLLGAINSIRRGALDPKIAAVLITGGAGGAAGGVFLFALLRRLGQLDLTITLGYVVLLGTLGTLMLIESVSAIIRDREPGARRRKMHEHSWLHRLPFKLRFRQSKLYISALLPLGLGGLVGVFSALLGIGGGFMVLPALIYLLGMPAKLAPGTALLQTVCVSAITTLLQAAINHTVDIPLALVTLLGGVVGVRFGNRVARRLGGDLLRVLMAVVVLAVGGKLLFDLTDRPVDIFTITARGG